MPETLLSCKNIILERGGRRILDVEALDIYEGEVLAVLGATGAGKSSLLNVLGMTTPPDSGEVLWRGARGFKTNPGSETRRKVSMALQSPLLFRGTVTDNVAYGLKLRKTPRPEIDKEVTEILELFGISHLARANAASLSGGEAHRVSLARSIVFHPDLLLLDEPMSSLDPGTKEKIIIEVIGIVKKLGLTCVYVTHSREEAYMVSDRMAVIYNGKIVQVGTADDVLYRPATAGLAIFTGVENVVEGVVEKQEEGLATISISGAKVEAISNAPEGAKVTVCVRPEEVFIKLSTTDSAVLNDSARNRLTGRIERIDLLGPTVRIIVDCGFPLKALITRRSLEEMDIGLGSTVIAGFKATSAHVIEQNSS